MTKTELELAWLRWFYINADFGPADGDVRAMLKRDYKSKGYKLPAGYEERGVKR